MSNDDAQTWYLEKEKKISEKIDRNKSLKDQAKEVHKLRNVFRNQMRYLMADRNTAEYLEKAFPNPNWEQIQQKQVVQGFSGDDIYKAIIEEYGYQNKT